MWLKHHGNILKIGSFRAIAPYFIKKIINTRTGFLSQLKTSVKIQKEQFYFDSYPVFTK